eukprot:scaffold56930_cov19-Tisochrysis_lutea.AAC.1
MLERACQAWGPEGHLRPSTPVELLSTLPVQPLAHFSTRPMSVDDIRKQKQKEANKALLMPHQRLSAASQASQARPLAAPGNASLGRGPVGGPPGGMGPHMGGRGHMNGGRFGASGS